MPRSPLIERMRLVEDAHDLDQEVGRGAGRHLARLIAEALAQDVRDLAQPEVLIGGDEALPAGLRRGHREDVQLGDVADVDEGEAELRDRRHVAGDQAVDRLDREGVVVVQDGADDRPGLDRRQALLVAGLLDQVPGGALGDRLRAGVGGLRGVVAVGPVGLGVGAGLARLVGRAGGGDRGGHHDPLGAGLQRHAQHPQRPVAGGDDEVVRVVGLHRRERRGDVQDVAAVRDRRRPALVGGEVGDDHLERVAAVGAGLGQGRPQSRLALQVADGGADVVAALEQLDDAPASEEAGAAADEDPVGLLLLLALHRSRPAAPAAPSIRIRLRTSPASRASCSCSSC